MPIIGNAGPMSKIYEKNYATDNLNIVVNDSQFSPYQSTGGGLEYTLTATFEEIVANGNTTPKTIEFKDDDSFVTEGNVGILNTAPTHTLDLGSNLSIDEFGSNVILARGNIYTEHLKSYNATNDNDVTTKNLIATEDVRCKDVYTNNLQSRTTQHVYVKSNMGLMNNQPTHEFSVQDKLFIEAGSSNVLYTSGNIYSAHFKSSNVTSSNIYTSNVMSLENEIFIHSNVGILNTEPIHTLDLGSNLSIDEFGSNVILARGNIHANRFTGDSVIIAGTVSATQFLVGGSAQTNIAPALQTVAEKTPFSADRTMTLSHPTTGVIVNANVRALTVYSNVIGQNVYTTGDIKAGPNPLDPVFYVKTSTGKIGINEIAPVADLHVTGNAYVSSNVTVDTDTLYVDATNDRVGVNKIPTTALDVSGIATFDNDLIVDTNKLYVDATNGRVGINKTPTTTLDVSGIATFDNDLIVDTDTLHVDVSSDRVGINKLTPDASLHVVGNTHISSNLTVVSNLTVDTNTLHVDASSDRVGINKLTPDASLHVVGNTHISSNLTVVSNLTVATDTLHVDVSSDRVGINKLIPDSSLDVNGNAYVSSGFSHGGLVPTPGTEIDQIKTFTSVSLSLTDAWQSTTITGADLATGSYMVQLFAHENAVGENFNEYYTGFMSWYAGATNSTESNEIVLHAAGEKPSSNHTYLRVTRALSSGVLTLEIRKDTAITNTPKDYTFKFRRMI